MKTSLEILNKTEEILSKSAKSEKLDPEDIVDNGKDIQDEVEKQEEKKKEKEKDTEDEDDLTPEEREALESGEYDYEPEDEDETEEDEDEEDDDTIEEGEETRKSMENILVILGNTLNRVESLEKSLTRANRTIQKLSGKNEELSKSLKGAPLGRKSVSKASILEKSFNTSAGILDTPDIETLSKSQKAEVLSKALINGNSEVTAADVINAEMSGTIRPELMGLFKK